jgi:hypothetical protein
MKLYFLYLVIYYRPSAVGNSTFTIAYPQTVFRKTELDKYSYPPRLSRKNNFTAGCKGGIVPFALAKVKQRRYHISPAAKRCF